MKQQHKCRNCGESGHNIRTCPVAGRAPVEGRATQNAYHRDRRAKAAAKGMCAQCAIRPALPGLRRCQDCTDRTKQYAPVLFDRKCNGGCGTLLAKDGPRKCPACRRARRGWNAPTLTRPKKPPPNRPEGRLLMVDEDYEGWF
jgi:hypothetical protein